MLWGGIHAEYTVNNGLILQYLTKTLNRGDQSCDQAVWMTNQHKQTEEQTAKPWSKPRTGEEWLKHRKQEYIATYHNFFATKFNLWSRSAPVSYNNNSIVCSITPQICTKLELSVSILPWWLTDNKHYGQGVHNICMV